MTYSSKVPKWLLTVATVGACSAGLSSVAAETTVGASVAGSWQARKDTFDFYGITTLYSCSSLEDRVKEILILFGARKDMQVFATGCARGNTELSHFATVRAEFYTLAPAALAGGAGVVNAQWTALELSPRHPFFMGDGDCELVKEMQDLLRKNFSLRDVTYTTDCVPHDITINGFSVKAHALKAVPPVKVGTLTGREAAYG